MYGLLQKRQFLPFFLTQFFGAFNDNAFKFAMLTLISYHLSGGQSVSEHYQALAGALFTLPFLLFSATAGQLADRYDRVVLTRIIKTIEIVLVALGSASLMAGSVWGMMATLTGLGIHSTFFGPIKYALLPDLLPTEALLAATSWVEASTFIAILLGTVLGALTIGRTTPSVIYAVWLINIMAVFGWVSSWFIPRMVKPFAQVKMTYNPWFATISMVKEVVYDKRIFPAICAISWFWLLGVVVLTKLPDYAHYTLHAEASVFSLFLALFSIGIAIGALVIGRLLKSNITLTYVPVAMLVLSVFAYDLYLATPKMVFPPELPLLTIKQFLKNWPNLRISIDLFLVALFAGMFVVPLYTYLQVADQQDKRARTIAANNIFGAFAMVIGSLMVMAMLSFGLGIAAVFGVLAGLNAVVAIVLGVLLPKYCANIKM